MSIKCGHCGERHETVAQTRLCAHRKAYMTAAQRARVAEELGRHFSEADPNNCDHVMPGLDFCVVCGTPKSELSLYGNAEIDGRFDEDHRVVASAITGQEG